jgi:hypothetical protein
MFSWKTTRRDMKTDLVNRLKSLYPLVPFGYPMKIKGIDLWSNLPLSRVSVETKAKHPKTRRWEYMGGVEYNSSNGDLFDNKGEGIQLMRWVAVETQSPQKQKGRWAWNLKARATFRRCWCFLSTTEFCWGVSTQLSWCKVPCWEKKSSIWNSTPLSDIKVLRG